MITLEAVRSALLLSDSPYDRLDRLVKAELAVGRKVRAVFDDLNSFVDAVLETPGLTTDAEEAFLGTLDALTDGCNPASRYADSAPVFPPFQTSTPTVIAPAAKP